MDSWRPWKLDPGFVVMYSKLSVFKTSIMKSEPGFSTMRSTRDGAPVSTASCESFGTTAEGRGGAVGVDCWAFAAGVATRAAALAAAPFRKPRRLTEPFPDFMNGPLNRGLKPAFTLFEPNVVAGFSPRSLTSH